MRTEELMLEDLVLSTYPSGRRFATRMNIAEMQNFLDEEYEGLIDPIPLTNEILQANGFDAVKDGDTYTIWKQKDDKHGNELYDITIYRMEHSDVFDTRVRHHGMVHKDIKYVHELQQALRMCGLRDMADKFVLTRQ